MIVFVAEDNPADVYLLREALGGVEMIIATDGEEAMEFAERRGRYENGPLPHLIILDLNLPKSDGNEVLRVIRSSEILKSVPVIVLTSSDSPRDRALAQQLGADHYLTKPSDLDEFLAIGRKILTYATHEDGTTATA